MKGKKTKKEKLKKNLGFDLVYNLFIGLFIGLVAILGYGLAVDVVLLGIIFSSIYNTFLFKITCEGNPTVEIMIISGFLLVLSQIVGWYYVRKLSKELKDG